MREREWEASHTIWLWIDRSASMGFASANARTPKVDRALVMGLALADVLVDKGERVGLLGLTRPLASRNIVERMIETLALDEAGTEQDLPPLQALGRQDEAILISDWLTPHAQIDQTFRAIGTNGVRGHVVMIVDPAEETFPFAARRSCTTWRATFSSMSATPPPGGATTGRGSPPTGRRRGNLPVAGLELRHPQHRQQLQPGGAAHRRADRRRAHGAHGMRHVMRSKR